MASLAQTKTGAWKSRQRVPKDVAEEYGRLFGQRYEAKLFIPAGIPSREAKLRHAEWIAEHEGRVKAIRAARNGTPLILTQREARALAGEWYNWWIARYEANPGRPEDWNEGVWSFIEDLQQFAPNEVQEQRWSDLEWARDPDVRVGIRPKLSIVAEIPEFLAVRGIALADEARALFLDAVVDNYIPAMALLERRARGDYGPDDRTKHFPKFTRPQTDTASRVTPRELFDEWVRARKPKQSSVESWRTVFNALTARFPDCAAGDITVDQAQEWIDSLVTEERSANTVRSTWVRAARAVYSWGKTRKLVAGNPFAEVLAPKGKRTRHRPKSFYEHEYTAIQSAAKMVDDTSRPDHAARRWVPWVQAYTGARPGEITQLRAQDVQQVGGIWTINLTPDAGTIKTDEARLVPLHEHLIEQGFLEFAKAKDTGPLFYHPRRNAGTTDPTRQKKTPAAQVRQRLASWIGAAVGVKAKGLSPNHAWRHTFKLLGGRANISEKHLDYICGHTPATEGRAYGEPTLEDMAAAIYKISTLHAGCLKQDMSNQVYAGRMSGVSCACTSSVFCATAVTSHPHGDVQGWNDKVGELTRFTRRTAGPVV